MICIIDIRYRGRARSGQRRGGRGRARGKGPVPTAEELDAELDAYNKQVSNKMEELRTMQPRINAPTLTLLYLIYCYSRLRLVTKWKS